MRAAIAGAAGQLGLALADELKRRGDRVAAWTRRELDVTDAEAVRRRIGEESPDVVFNGAAFTDVDAAEAEPELARAVNEHGAANLADACAAADAVLVHVSTDFVFDGELRRPYRPGDEPRPLSVYGATKLAGERRVESSRAEWLIVRTSWVYGAGDANFVRTVVRLAAAARPLRIVHDQTGSPTWTAALAAALVSLADRGARGTLHVADDAGPQGVSRLAQARAVLEELGLEVPIEGVPTSAFPRPARRPAWSVLDLADAERALTGSLPFWRDSLRRMLAGDERIRGLQLARSSPGAAGARTARSA